jgi:autotransporter passenger strand-loop-strand repeat protein
MQRVYSGGRASGTVISSGGFQYVSSGGIVTNSIVNSDGIMMLGIGCFASGFNVSSGGILGWDFNAVFSGSSNGISVVSSSGKTSYNLYLNFGTQSVLTGYTANSATIIMGGIQYVVGGKADNAVVYFGGNQHVSAGGTVSNTTINSGYQYVSSGGTANKTVINGGSVDSLSYLGCQYVSSGGTANDTVINFLGQQYVYSGGTASNVTVNTGGWQYVAGGSDVGTLTIAGGRVTLEDASAFDALTTVRYELKNAMADNVLLMVNGGMLGTDGTATYSLDLNNTAAGSYILASGNLSGMSGKNFTVTYNSEDVNLQVGASYTFTDGNQLKLEIVDSTNDLLTATFKDIVLPTVPADLKQTIVGNSVTLDWADSMDVAGIKQYEVQIDDNAVFSSPDAMSAVASEAVVNGLAEGVYYWRVRAQDNSGNYSKWSSGNFMLESTVPTVPASLKQTITGNNVELDWTNSTDNASGIKGYEVQMDNSADFNAPEYTASPTLSEVVINNLADGIYYWRVRAQDNSGNYSEWNTGSSFMVDATAPSVPSGLAVIAAGNNVTLDWRNATDAVSGLKQYEFQVDNNADFTTPECVASPAVNTASVSTLADGSYFWRVRAVDNNSNYSAWSSTSRFLVDTVAPSVPDGLTETVIGNNVTLDWNDATDAASGVKQYEFQVNNKSDFLKNKKTGTVAASSVNISGLADGIYYWRVRTMDNSGNYSEWNTGSSFMADATAPSAPDRLTAIVSVNNATLDWSDATDAASGVKQYEFQVDNNSDFSSSERNGISAVSNIAVSSLADGIYYWRVRTMDNNGNYSDWRNGNNLVIDSAAPTVPEVLTRTITGNNVVFDWSDATDAASGVKQYEFQLDNNAGFSSPEYSVHPVASTADVSGLADGGYFWRVRTIDNNGNYSGWSIASDFLVDTVAPSVPGGLTETVTGSLVTLDWNNATDNASGLKQYEFQVDNDSNFSSNEKSGTVTASNAGVTGLADGVYYWRVRTQDNSGNYSAWNAGSRFMVDSATPSVPAGMTRIVSGNNVKLDWADATDAVSGVKHYEIQVDQDIDFSSPDYSALSAASNASVTGLADGAYYWRVRTQDNAGNWSSWARGFSFVSDLPGNRSGALLLSAPSVAGRVSADDQADYYKLIMTNAGVLTLNLTGLTGDANLSLLDAGGKVLKNSANRGNASETIANFLLSGGSYYVNVASVRGVNSAAYILSHSETYFPADKAGNTWQAAKDISGGVDNWVGFGDPADCYKLVMAKNGTLKLDLSGLTGDANLSLLDANGKTLKTSANGLKANEAIAVDLLAGTYYVNVASATGVNRADYTLTHAEKYFPDDKAGNNFTAARQVTARGPVNEWLGLGDKDDYYKFELKTGTTAALNLSGMNSNVDLYLYDSKFRQLAASRKTGNAAEIISKALQAGTYYVKTTLAGKDNTDYNLSFNIDSTAFKSGGLQLFGGASSPLTSGADIALTNNDQLKKNQGMLAS